MGEEEGVVVVLAGGLRGGRGAVAKAEAGGEVEEAVGVEAGWMEAWDGHHVFGKGWSN